MKILVSGAGGFIGSCLVDSMRDEHALVRCSRSGLVPIDGVVDFAVDDIDADTDWSDALQQVDAVVHLAALAHRTGAAQPSLEQYREVNTSGSVTLARQAIDAGVKRFVFLSSIGVNGQSTSEPFSELSPCRPHSDYALSKFEAEQALAAISAKSSMELVIIRAPLVYGSRAPANFRQLVRLVSKLPLLPFGLVDNARSLVHVENLVDFIELCCHHPQAAGEIFLISDDQALSTRGLTDLIAQSLGKRVLQLPLPAGLMRLGAQLIGKPQLATQLLDNLEIDNSRAKMLLGWTPPLNTREGILECDFSPMLVPPD